MSHSWASAGDPGKVKQKVLNKSGELVPTPVSSPTSPGLDGFENYIKNSIIPLLFNVARGLDMKDAQSVLVVGEIALLHRCMYAGHGDSFLALVKGLLDSQGMDGNGYVEVLRSGDGKAVTKFFKKALRS